MIQDNDFNLSCDNTNYNQLIYQYEKLNSLCKRQDNYINNLESENMTLLKNNGSFKAIVSQIKKDCVDKIEEHMNYISEMKQSSDELKSIFMKLEKKLLEIDKRIDDISKEVQSFSEQAENCNQVVAKALNSNMKLKDELNLYEKLQATIVMEIEEIKDIIKSEAEDIVYNSNKNKMLLEEIIGLKKSIEKLKAIKHFNELENEEDLARAFSHSYISLDELDTINEKFDLKAQETTNELKVKLIFYIIFIFIIFLIIRYVYFHGQILTVERIQEHSIV